MYSTKPTQELNLLLSLSVMGSNRGCTPFQVPCSCWPDDISLSDHDCKAALEGSLKHFQSEIPVLGLLGSPRLIDHNEPLVADANVQLVCKYLRAYHDRTIAGIDRLYIESKELFLCCIAPYMDASSIHTVMHFLSTYINAFPN